MSRLIMALTVAMLLAACGSTPNSTPVPTPMPTSPLPVGEEDDGGAAAGGDPCAVVTGAELESAVGKPVTRQDADGPRCTYYTDDPVVFVTLEVDQENAEASWQGVTAGQDLTEAQSDEVTGLGDEAFFGARDILYVRSGDTFLMVEAGFDDKVRDRAEKVARLVLDKVE